MNGNRLLNIAKHDSYDEFYTSYLDVQAEIEEYPTGQFRGKAVYCNADDYRYSNFYKYLRGNFRRLELRRVCATSYKSRQRDMFTGERIEPAMLATFDSSGERVTPLEGDGDFRSGECKEILDRSDMVITNPPFSLFSPFVKQLETAGKDFLIMGNMNAITYIDFFPLLQSGEVKIGVHNRGAKWFQKLGGQMVCLGQVVWYTTLLHCCAPPGVPMEERYRPSRYRRYDNMDAIDVPTVRRIPHGYDGLMGVPITYMLKHNPRQFEIAGFMHGDNGKQLTVDGRRGYPRVVIRPLPGAENMAPSPAPKRKK